MATASELTINTAASALDMANAIFGPGITVTGATFTGDAGASGIYSGALASIPGISQSDSGVILSTGRVTDFTNSSGTTDTNTAGNTGIDNAGVNGDSQLNAVAGMGTFDGAILQANFIPDGDYLTMQFVFSSEEYPEYVNGGVNDSFGVWVNGNFVPVSITIAGNISIDAVNGTSNENFYRDNTADQFNTEMDGFTYTLSLKAPVNAGQVNTIKIGIADGGDAVWDSNLLIMGDSIQTVTLAFDDDANVVAGGSRTFDILANDSNANGTLTITQIQGTDVVAGQTVTLASGQQVRLNADGTITVFATSAIGTENFSYTVSDAGVTDIGYVSINTSAAGALDGIVSGTTSDDFIDAFYTGDIDGDRVDNNDATGVQGTTGNGDVIQAGAGNDYVLAGLGNDIIEAGTGNDVVDGGAGDDRAELGAGNDSYQTADPLAAGNDTVLGEAGNDAVLTGDGNDVIYGGTGNDSLQGGAGADALYGGDDADRLLANAGDVVVGGEGGNDNDTLVANGVASVLYGGGNNEAGTLTFADGSTLQFSQIEKLELNGGNPDGIIAGTAGNDIIGAGYVDANGDVIDNNDSILTTPQGTNGDEVYAGDGDDTVFALLGDDFVYGGAGNDSISGGVSNDYMQGDAGNDIVIAGDGNDFIRGDAGNDFVYGGDGDDSTYGGAGNDQVFGGLGNDQMFGGFGNDTVYGGEGNDTVTGSGDTDVVYGDDGDDSMQGSYGNDTLYGGAGNDTMLGEEDADSFYAGAGDYVDGYETVISGTDNDTLYVSGVASVVFDTLNPENGVVTFTAGGSLPFYNIENVYADGVLIGNRNYIVDGTTGADLINASYVDGQGDRIDANDNQTGSNDDIVLAGAGNDTVLSGAGNDQITAGVGDDVVNAGTGDDLVYGGDGNDLVSGGFGNDTLYGADGDDNLSGGGVNGSDGDDLIDGGAGNDTLLGGVQADTIYGGAGDDLINGGPDKSPDGRDLLDGGGGNDSISGGFEADTLIGGAGDDQMSGESDSDIFMLADGFGFDTIVGGEDAGETDFDVLDASDTTEGSEIRFTGDETGTYTSMGSAGGVAFSEVEQLILGTGRDAVDGSNAAGGIYVHLGAGSDVAYGGVGADTIFADSGADIVQGGQGNDLIDLGAADGNRDLLNMVDGDGSDIVTGFEAPIDNGDGTFTGLDLLEVSSMTDVNGNPVNVLDVVVSNDGSGNAVLTFPNGESITLVGVPPASVSSQAALIALGIPPAGDGIVSGTAAGDLIDAGYVGDPDGDRIDANDALLPGAVGNDDLVQAGQGNDTVTAGDGRDDVFGGAGDDVLFGGAGNDTLTGGIGNDSLEGGANNDALTGEDGNDTLVGGYGSDSLAAGSGDDTVYDEIIGGVSGGGADTVDLGDGNDVFIGSGQNVGDTDLIYGGSGNDVITVRQSFDTVYGGDGDDVIQTLDEDPSYGDQLFGDAGNDAITGSNTNDQLYGGTGDDSLFGGGNSDTLDGGAGNDSLNAGDGNDLVYGGDGGDLIDASAGNDTVYGGADTDTIKLQSPMGTDSLFGGETGFDFDTIDMGGHAGAVSVIYTGAEAGSITGASSGTATFAQIENLVLTASNDTVDARADTAGIFVSDTGGQDAIRGGSGNDTVFSGSGNDTLAGGAGNDALYGGTWDDVFVVEDNFGTDQVSGGSGYDTIDLSALTGPVNVTLTGNGAGTVTNAGNVITFTSIEHIILTDQADVADASASTDGAMYFQGLGGNDVIIGGSGNDVYDDQAGGPNGQGNDTFYGGAGNDSLWMGTDNDVAYGGTGNDGLHGEQGDDSLYGGAGDDLLSGYTGADSLTGGAGNDTLDLGGADSLVDYVALADGDGQDTVSAFEAPIDNGDGTYSGLDQLDVSDLTDASGTPVNVNDVVVSDDGSGNAVLTFPNGEAITLIGIPVSALGTAAALVAIGIPPAPDLVVDGTAASDLMNPGYIDAQGDQIDGSDGITDTIFGYAGDDTIGAGTGNDLVFGGIGNDSLNGELGNDTLDGGAGNDQLFGGEGNDGLTAGDGDDYVEGGLGQDTIFGGDGNDALNGGARNDLMYGGADSDSFDGGDGDDTLYGGSGVDDVRGSLGNDLLYGDDGNDRLLGGDGNDTLIGGDGIDTLGGNNDRDTFFVGAGDVVDGGEGGDDYDVLDLSAYTHAGTQIVYNIGDPESGTVQFLDSAGLVTGSMAFSNIEKVVACFTLGCMIQAERGEVAVEELQPGDKVLTRDHGLQPIRWVGRRDLSNVELARAPQFSPIRIEKGALGYNLPQRDMMISPQHRMLVTGARAELLFGDAEVLVAATHMVGMPGVQRVYPRGISYVHILFDQHQIVRADGVWSESFQPGVQTLSGLEDAQRDEVLALFPHLKDTDAYPAARMKLKAKEARALLQT